MTGAQGAGTSSPFPGSLTAMPMSTHPAVTDLPDRAHPAPWGSAP